MHTYGHATPALCQRPLHPIKDHEHNPVWIVATFLDRGFCLSAYHVGDLHHLVGPAERTQRPYGELWDALAAMTWGRRKAWLIGWRVRYAMDKAGFLDALSSGKVALPRIKDGVHKGKVGGKLTYNRRVVEVDLVCGKNHVKMLGWENFGVTPANMGVALDAIDPEYMRLLLANYLIAMESIGVPVCKTTAAQLGWSKFRRDCQPDTLAVNLDDDSRALERQAYFGGRNECYRLGDIPGTTFSLDVRSCYASVCMDEEVPAWLDCEYRAGLDAAKIDRTPGYQWIADVEIVTPDADYPVDWCGAPVYPIGKFRTSLAWPELRHALERGRVVKVHRAARYRSRHVFRRYAEWYMVSRGALAGIGLSGCAPALKAIFNASLGYTARQKYDWMPWDQEIGHQYWIGLAPHPETEAESVAAQKLDGEARWLKIAGEPREAMPFLHATICSWARVRLLDIFARAGRENILYVDTDGILCTRRGWQLLVDDTALHGDAPGQLRQRFDSGSARIQGQKSYCIGDNWVQAGVVRSRYNGLVGKRQLTTATGNVHSGGAVTPFEFRCVAGKSERVY